MIQYIKLKLFKHSPHTHTHTHIYIYGYVYVCIYNNLMQFVYWFMLLLLSLSAVPRTNYDCLYMLLALPFCSNDIMQLNDIIASI